VSAGGKSASEFRNYGAEARAGVADFYRENHVRQTLAFVLAKKAEYLPLRRRRMGVWQAVEYLSQLVDASDPDLELPQIEHALQTAEALRHEGRPQWMVLAGFLHDLGKVLCLFGEPQWAVVGDTFPVGCAFSDKIVYAEFFSANPDTAVPEYTSRTGIYHEGCGLDAVHLSWGHDEYLYHVLRPYLPEEALAIVRWHSFYAAHRDREYEFLMNASDHRLLAVVREFNPYDLYSKTPERPDFDRLRPYYEDLVTSFLPDTLQW